MQRRNFLKKVSGGATAAYLSVNPLMGYVVDYPTVENSELSYHTIEKVSTKKVQIQYPRFVSKNAIKGNHGWGYDETVCELQTDKGAKGWGVTLWGRSEDEASDFLIGKKDSELFAPEKGLLNAAAAYCDIALHDLAGKILKKPVYEMMGASKPEI